MFLRNDWGHHTVKYTGTSLTIGAALLLLTNYYLLAGHLVYFHIISLVTILVLMIWLGMKYDQEKNVSEKDYLTKTYTRKYVCQKFPKLSRLVDKKSKKMFVFLLDLNNFKIINDQFGHDVGDQVLCHVASLLKKVTNKTDIVCRWGGDEFIILSTSSNPVYFKNFNHRLEEELRQFNAQKQLNVEISLGKAIFPNEGKTLNDLIKIADKNMYKEKALFRKSMHSQNEMNEGKIKTSAR
jgi:diguanylate cyclase (GGDEF)-like protein